MQHDVRGLHWFWWRHHFVCTLWQVIFLVAKKYLLKFIKNITFNQYMHRLVLVQFFLRFLIYTTPRQMGSNCALHSEKKPPPCPWYQAAWGAPDLGIHGRRPETPRYAEYENLTLKDVLPNDEDRCIIKNMPWNCWLPSSETGSTPPLPTTNCWRR